MNLYFRLLALLLKVRRQERLSMWDTAVTKFRVWPNDLDLLGHMNNGRYLTILDLGRMDLMLRSGYWKKTQSKGWYPVVAGQTITFRKSLNPFMKFDLHTRFLGLDEHGVYMEQTFCVGDEVYAKAHIRARFLKKKGGRVTNEELIELVGDVPEHLQIPEWLSEWGRINRQIPKMA